MRVTVAPSASADQFVTHLFLSRRGWLVYCGQNPIYNIQIQWFLTDLTTYVFAPDHDFALIARTVKSNDSPLSYTTSNLDHLNTAAR